MTSIIGDARREQQQAQDAEAYRGLVRQMEDDSLAKSAVAKSRAEYDNADMGWGLTRADVARAIGRPTSEVSVDTLDDQSLKALGQQKMMNQEELLRTLNARQMYDNELTAEDKARQMAMQQAGQDMSSERLGLAGQMSGRAINHAAADRFVSNIQTPGGINMNADRYVPGRQTGESSDIMPSSDAEIRDLKRRGVY